MIVLREDILEFAKHSTIYYLDETRGKKPMSENRTPPKVLYGGFSCIFIRLYQIWVIFSVLFSDIGFLPPVSSK